VREVGRNNLCDWSVDIKFPSDRISNRVLKYRTE